jgi:hypothetical protein
MLLKQGLEKRIMIPKNIKILEWCRVLGGIFAG